MTVTPLWPPPGRATLSRAETCKALGISLRMLSRKLRTGEIQSFKLGGRILIPVAGLDRMISRGDDEAV